ncbi:MAG: DNA-protecting protein DprA [Gammaproteobacteria bacterium]|nr:DNA-protecting protein DprA [Gammaproteobacteria bacterium]
MHSSELSYWLALNRILVGGARTFLEIKKRFPNISDLFRESRAALQALSFPEGLIQNLKSPDWKGVERDLAWAKQDKQTIVILEDAHYPAWLKTIIDPPPVLYVKGQLESLLALQLAIVGSRNPTHTGRSTAFSFAKALSEQGLVITSGLAMGIDAAAHEGALAGGGITIAVAGTGLDEVYPKQNTSLAKAISEKGALISELPLEKQPRAIHFPMRNRIISGLARGTLVVEATLKSGSLITARCALEQGREVFAIPSSIHNPLSKGCHVLIRQGAKLVENMEDILEELPAFRQKGKSIPSPHPNTSESHPTSILSDTLSQEHEKLLACLGFEPIPIDVLIARTKLGANRVASLLLALELQGKVQGSPGGYIRLE